jgi:tetratricopeptide (TPR) repeat protein
VEQLTACTQCGTKIAVTRDRCPRCRAHVVRVDQAAEAAKSRKLARAAGILVATFGLAVVGLWATSDPGPETATAPVTAADPLAARRQPAAAATPPAETPPAAAASSPAPFMDRDDQGAVAYRAGDYATALSQYEAAVQQNPNDPEALSNLGQMLVRLQRTAEAIPHFEKATALNPNRWAYRFNLARALGLLERWDESVASYRQAQTLFTDDYVTTFNLGLALHKKRDEAGAAEEFKKAIALNPNEASFRLALATSYDSLNRKDEAAGQYAEYLRLSPLAADADKVRSRICQLTNAPIPATPAAPATPPAGNPGL